MFWTYHESGYEGAEKISDGAREFLRSMLAVEPGDRATARELLLDGFLKDEDEDQDENEDEEDENKNKRTTRRRLIDEREYKEEMAKRFDIVKASPERIKDCRLAKMSKDKKRWRGGGGQGQGNHHHHNDKKKNDEHH